MEPGRYLVGPAGLMLTRVLHRKHSGGREIAIVDAGMNDLLRPALYRAWHEIVPVGSWPGDATPTDIVGPVCETGDFLALERPLAPVPVGGLLAVLGAGAYAFAISSNNNTRARAAEADRRYFLQASPVRATRYCPAGRSKLTRYESM